MQRWGTPCIGSASMSHDTLGIRIAQQVIEEAMVNPEESPKLNMLFNTNTLDEHVADPGLPRRYVTKPGRSGVSREAAKALKK